MRNEADELISDLIRRWHVWSVSTPPNTGYYKANPSCKLYKTSRQYDDSNGALDSDAENGIMEAVDHAIDCMEQPWRTAIAFNARNLATNLAVWNSPRLPVDEIERAHLVMHARAKLLLILESNGVA